MKAVLAKIKLNSFYPSAILGRWGTVVASGICPSVHLSVHQIYWHQTIIAYLPCPVLVPRTIILSPRPLTLVRWPLLVTAKLPERNITSIPKRYICCILSISQMNSKGTFQGHIGHHDLGLCLIVQYCLNRTSHQCQNGTFGEFYQSLWWVLTFDLLFKVRSFSDTCLSVHPISPSLYIWLTSNHHCIFNMSSSCTLHYYFGSLTFDLGTVTFTLTLLVTA